MTRNGDNLTRTGDKLIRYGDTFASNGDNLAREGDTIKPSLNHLIRPSKKASIKDASTHKYFIQSSHYVDQLSSKFPCAGIGCSFSILARWIVL